MYKSAENLANSHIELPPQDPILRELDQTVLTMENEMAELRKELAKINTSAKTGLTIRKKRETEEKIESIGKNIRELRSKMLRKAKK